MQDLLQLAVEDLLGLRIGAGDVAGPALESTTVGQGGLTPFSRVEIDEGASNPALALRLPELRLTRNVVGSLHVLPKEATFTGMRETAVAFVEWKAPSFAIADAGVQKAYYRAASDILFEMAGGKLARDNIYINVVHTVDGAWNFEGERMTNSEIGARVALG